MKPGRRIIIGSVIILAGIGLYYGWRTFWFLTDDAFIAFRYVSNSIQGYGYTWNLPPFRPVEGYTSFLWVLLLDILWRVTGLEPPAVANTLSLLWAYGTTLLSIAMLLKLKLIPALEKVHLWLLILAVAGILTNRTYLTWTSSGLETAMFNFFVTAWFFSCLFLPLNTPRWRTWSSLTAVLTALSRPDGALLIAATLGLNGLSFYNEFRMRRLRLTHLASLSPFLLTIAHFLWRKTTYGEWLPNTYAAKYVTPWPESGLRYMLSFIIEYSLWFWLLLVGVCLVFCLRKLPLRQVWHPLWLRTPAPNQTLVALVVIGTLLTHFTYYTFIIGGDHFEYRVYSHLVPLIFVSCVWFLNTLHATSRQALIFTGLCVLSALPIPWTHWSMTHNLDSQQENYRRDVPIASQFPQFIRPYIHEFDALQSWLIEHLVCIRHQEHRIFYRTQLRGYPPRAVGKLLNATHYPVMVSGAVGIPGWQMPTTNIIDRYGLNDYVVARNPVDPSRERQMAHARYLPPGYAECFQPNVKAITDKKIVITQRDLTPQTIIECEDHDWPAGIGDKYGSGDLGINNIDTPMLDNYLWYVWPADPLYLYYVPSAQEASNLNQQLVQTFPAYTGRGCVVIPPHEHLTSHTDYLFAFLPWVDRPDLQTLRALFPWTDVVTTDSPEYHLGYTALAGPESIPVPTHPLTASWDNSFHLLGYDLPQTTYAPGENLHFTLYYRNESTIAPGYSFFVHLLERSTTEMQVWGQDDGDSCRGLYPMEMWQPGSNILNKIVISLPDNIPVGKYELVTGFYNWQTQGRVLLSENLAGQDNLYLDSIQIQSP
ncbi:MAG: hypothetical protein JXA33_24445 [Anaerolineae bacterium]|nr:hypothetical protein [Anaerolineae bacterium]